MMPSRIARAGSLTQRAGPPACYRSTGLPTTTGNRERPNKVHKTNSPERSQPHMTSLIPRALSERAAPHRGEPATARTFNWHPRQGAPGIVSLRLDCEIFHRTKTSANWIAKARAGGHRAITGDNASVRLTRIVFPDECGKGSPVAIGPVVALDTSETSFLTPPRQSRRARHGRGATWDRGPSARNLAPPSWPAGSQSAAMLTPRYTSR